MRRAHTLMELVVVLTLLVLAAGIAAPRLISRWSQSQLDAALEAVRGDLQFARARAISTGLRHQFVMDPSTLEVFVQPFRPETLEAGGAAAPEGSIALQDRLPEGVGVATWTVSPLGAAEVSAQDGATALTFYPEGRSDSGLLILTDGQSTRRGLQVDGFSAEIRELTPDELRERF
ncbi:MAG TPA: GspH/FimT family pseudopilin [Armatimonadota bacterium]|nr:GspH/FimT family pseudopilin [Armatimonadota bacterium]